MSAAVGFLIKGPFGLACLVTQLDVIGGRGRGGVGAMFDFVIPPQTCYPPPIHHHCVNIFII